MIEKFTWRTIITHSEVRWGVRSDVGKTFRTVLSSAANLRSTLPNNLRKVAPIVEVGHIRLGLPVETVEVRNFAVVEEFCDDRCDIIRSKTSSDVLTVATTICSCVVGINTSRGDLGSSRRKGVVPDEVACRMIGTVDVV
jgi:hypothetical protein